MPFDETLVDKGSYFYWVPEGETPPPVGDGINYSRALGWQSPEGNFYGQERWVRDWHSAVIWTGEDYEILEELGAADSVDDLPIPGEINPRTGEVYGPRLPFEIWTVPRPNWPPPGAEIYDGRLLDYYWWNVDTQAWVLAEWYWLCEGEEALPRPGVKLGACHIIVYYDIKVMWNGYYWKRFSLDMLEGSERVDELETSYTSFITNTNGAIQSLEDIIDEDLRSRIAEARLEFLSKSLLGLITSVRGNTGALWVGGELLLVDDVESVSNSAEAVSYSNNTISYVAVTPYTEYYVYCGNTAFPSGPKLFLSLNEDINGKLGTVAPGSNARIVGVVEIDDQGYFRREIDMSYIGKRVEFSETFWEYSDYTLAYKDENTLEFQRLDGTSGLCYVNGQLLSLGTGKDVATDSYRILWNNGDPLLDDTAIAASTFYQIYIANDSYEYNFNEIGGDGLPLDEGDVGYDATKDFRRSLFLSTKEPDNRLFDQQYPGYYARHIGQVVTDSSGYFKYSSDISLIRQPTLNPTTVDGLAEITFLWEASTQIGIIAKRGTYGLVYVNGDRLTVDSLNCSYINTESSVYSYNSAITSPLDTALTVKDYVGRLLYLYITNTRPVWSSLASSMICCTNEPIGGYLDSNYPGNNCRWIGTIRQAPQITGSELVTNGSFSTDTSWVYDKGWVFDDPNDKMAHVSGVLPLSQNITLTQGQLYKVLFTTSGASSGSVKVSLGGTESASFSNNAAQDVDIVAGAGDYIYFIPTQTYNGSLDNISVKITSTELVVNGTCATDASWTKGGGWTHDAVNLHYDHTPTTSYLTQDIALANSVSYTLSFGLTVTSGTSITPCLGGTDGTAQTTSGTKTITLSAGSSDYVRFKPTVDFVGSLDNVTLIPVAPILSIGSWVCGGTWNTTFGYLQATNGGGGTAYYTCSLVEGASYTLTFTLLTIDQSITAKIGGTSGTTINGYTNATYSQTIVAGGNGKVEFYSAGGSYQVEIRDISIVANTDYITNGAFSSTSNWTCENGWSIGSGVASRALAYDNFTQNITLANSSTYKVVFTTSGRTAGSIIPCLAGTSGSAITANQANVIDMVAGAGNYLRFIATNDYDGNIDSVSLKLTGSELSTNGAMATDTGWDKKTGWVWDGTSYHMDFVPQTELIISQDISAIENEYYELTFNITNYLSGILTPKIGGVEGIAESSNGYKTQHILAGDSELLEFVASPTFSGSLDLASVRKTLGVFENSFLSESVAGLSASINDSVVSYSDTWSSVRIMAEIQKALGITSAAQTFEGQKSFGLSVKLEYVDTTHVRVMPTIENARVFFSADPNDYLDVPSGGVSLAVSGSVATLYYVWLAKESIYMNTTPPGEEYNQLSMLGDAVLVGYVGLSATNTMAGNWNVYSFYDQPTNEWTQAITTAATTTLTKNGLVIPPGVTATISRVGATTIYLSGHQPYLSDSSITISASGVDDIVDAVDGTPGAIISYSESGWLWNPYLSYAVFSSVSLAQSLNYSSIANTVLNTGIVFTQTFSYITGYTTNQQNPVYDIITSAGITAATGQITLLRPGNMT